MRARGRTLLPWLPYGAMLALLVATLTLTVRNRSFETFVAIAVLMMLGYGTVGALIASRREGGPLGWLMLTIGLGFVLTGFLEELLTYAVRTNPSAHVPMLTLAAWVSNWIFITVFTPIPLVLLLFPTGTVLSPRWRFLPPAIVALGALGVLGAILQPGTIQADVPTGIANPTGVPALALPVRIAFAVAGAGLLAAGFASVGSLILRFRRAVGDERQQIRWLAYLAGIGVVLLTLTAIAGITNPGENAVNQALWLGLFVCIGVAFPAAIGVAILKYRLYDLDLVVKKTVVFGILVALLMVVALAATVLVSEGIVGDLSRTPPLLLIAGVLYGLLVLPIYRAATRLADRIVYGGRATPYEVLTDFSQRVAGSYAAEDVLPRMARIVADALAADGAIVWLRVGDELRPTGVAAADRVPDPAEVRGDRLPPLPGDAAVEVRDRGELLGAITVSMPANDPMNPSKERLVRDLASQAGLVLRNVRLIEELRASRQRLVAAQDEERRRLERNIHDGAQQQLVALSVKLGLLEQLATRDPGRAAELATQLQTDTTHTLEDLRDLARGIYPPLLADEGLPAALTAQARKSSVEVTIHSDGIGRYPEDVEAAVYFSCLEALQNVTKYANASHVTISLAAEDRQLSFVVADDGVGFDQAAAHRGTGLQGIADRLDALRGRFEVVSRLGAGTTLTGSVPVD